MSLYVTNQGRRGTTAATCDRVFRLGAGVPLAFNERVTFCTDDPAVIETQAVTVAPPPPDPRLPPPTLPTTLRPVTPPLVVPLPPPAPTVDIRLQAVEGEMNSFETMQEMSENFVHKRLIGAGIGFLTGGPAGAAVGFVADPFGGGGGAAPSPAPTRSLVPQDPCPGGVQIPGTNRCFETPFVPKKNGGVVVQEQAIAFDGGAVPGVFGALSVSPTVMSAVRLRCPPGLVLGKDERCYAQGKGGISNSQRKWPKPPRPIMSAQDGKILRRAEAVRGRAKRAAMSAGFTCAKAGTSRRRTKKD